MIVADNKIDQILHSARVISRMTQAQPDARKSQKLYYQMISTYFNRIKQATENHEFIAAHTVFFPSEIIYAMGLVPMHTETTTWMVSLFTGKCDDIVSAGIEMGLASEI